MESLAALIDAALRLRSDWVAPLLASEAGPRWALTVVLLAGLAEAIGESVVLFLNRVRLPRFLLSLLISALLFAVTYAVLAASIHRVGRWAFGAEVALGPVARVVAVAYAPRLLGFLVFVPFFGQPLTLVLQIWSLLVTLVGVQAVMGLGPGAALACVLLGGLLQLTLERTVGRPLTALARWMRERAAGVDLVTDRRALRRLLDAGPDGGLLPPRHRRHRRGGPP